MKLVLRLVSLRISLEPERYRDQVGLLLDILPLVMAEPDFAWRRRQK
jgi:hypothetical protein